MKHVSASFIFITCVLLAMPLTSIAQQPATGGVTGTVRNPNGAPISGASVNIHGPSSAHAVTDANGAFTVGGLAPGIYTINVSSPAYTPATADLTVLAGSPVDASVVLQPVSFSSLRTIASVRTSRSSSINTSTAAINDLPATTFTDQGTQQVTQVLNQTPGVVTTMGAFAISNGGTMSTVQVPQIRGALPYETESLIDGHPVSVGAVGYFTPLYIDPHFLQDVEITKGPGSMPADINYAIGGSINYRTLAPTRDPKGHLELDSDNYGGLSMYASTTGTIANHRLGYAFAYGKVGTPGPLNDYTAFGIPNQLGAGLNGTINGQPICGASGGAGCLAGATSGPTVGSIVFTFPLVTCCDRINTEYRAHTELAKINYNFSQQTSFTLAYLGAQSWQNFPQSFSLDTSFFQPPAGYSGSIPAGTAEPYFLGTYQPNQNTVTQGLLESEFRTSVGRNSLLFRYYTGANDFNNYNVPFGITYTFQAKTWGGLPLGPGGAPVFFNGQTATFSVTDSGVAAPTQDHFNGLSGQIDIPVANNLLTFSLDRTTHNSYAALLFEVPGLDTTLIPHGSSQAFTTILARGAFEVTPKLHATLGNYFVHYNSHFTPDGGATWSDAGHNFYAPRLGVTWQPGLDQIYRLAVGSSIAPPYIQLITTQSGAPVPNNGGAATAYTETLNNGRIDPETAFGYDLGIDKRIARDTILSADVYETTLHGQFLNSVFVNGTFTPTTGINAGITAPLFISEAQNLGTSRYEGVEITLHKSPPLGLGYRLQGSLQRAYAYNLPPGFYDTAAGPNTTNLAVIPNINFQPSGDGYNGISNGRIPYSMGYGELNYRTKDAYYLVGVTYYGNNNTYNQPAFGVVNASARWQIAKNTALQVAGYNLTGTYSNPFFTLFGGIPVPLVNGQLGATAGINVGPTTFHLILHQDFGQ
jgi:outer membrane receptor protein involved in Fe transport